jgi:hypothetical protein
MKSALLGAIRLGGALCGACGVVGLLAATAARAEIVGWVDDSGKVTYTNMAPPKGAKVVDRIEEDRSEPRAAARPDPLRSDELRALNDRISSLEDDLRQAMRTPPSSQPPAYSPPPSPFASGTCDSWFFDCNDWGPSWAGPVYFSYGRGFAPRLQHTGRHVHDGGQWRHDGPHAPRVAPRSAPPRGAASYRAVASGRR